MTDANAAAPADPDEGRAAAAVVWLLYLLAIPSANILAVVGVIVAYVAREGSSPWVRRHFDTQISLFWSTIVWFILLTVLIIVSGILSLIIIGIPFLIAAGLAMLVLFIWFTVKSVIGLINVVQRRQP
ncbi:hypothetical protein [Brevundimonas lutea]|uniref:hypothetical protein n=1 Tax=Brevundimonas lutea TaxID=2293980 RepID=UPI000F027549|nr:hypothetical protein [Brevundimonas lutea]